ncbi:MAG: hypothetical protein ABIU09_00855 [Pyrinomonadaceae bacterium]
MKLECPAAVPEIPVSDIDNRFPNNSPMTTKSDHDHFTSSVNRNGANLWLVIYL